MAQIKRIQLRGISRNPSDRMTEDGGVAESLNMFLDNTEVAPMVEPKDVGVSLGLPSTLEASMIYIHKTANYENIIAVEPSKIVAYTALGSKDVIALAEAEEVYKIAAVGNSLAIATSVQMYYLLYKDQAYENLGNEVVFPNIEVKTIFSAETVMDEQRFIYRYLPQESEESLPRPLWYYTESNDQWGMPDQISWNDDSRGGRNHSDERILTLLNYLDFNQKTIGYNYETPMFIRIVAELYDGSILSTEPILCGAGGSSSYSFDITLTAFIDKEGKLKDYTSNQVTLKARRYTINAKLTNLEEVTKWKDIISSIKIYASPVGEPSVKKLSTALSSHSQKYTETKDSDGNVTSATSVLTASGYFRERMPADYKNELLDLSTFTYLIKEIPIKQQVGSGDSIIEGDNISTELQNLSNGITIYSELPYDETQLRLQPPLIGDDMKHYPTSAKLVSSYNNQLILVQPTSLVKFGGATLNAYSRFPATSAAATAIFHIYEVTWLLRISNRQVKSVKSFATMSHASKENIYAFQIFPDSRCYKMYVKVMTQNAGGQITDVKYGSFDMQPHPYLDCAYYYGGIDTRLITLCTDETIPTLNFTTEGDSENKLYVSEIDNPFVFPLEHRYTFQAPILNVGIATKALSQGQFGQFPLYVFTEDGIWAMTTAADGTFVTQKPVSRVICNNPDSVTSIDDAIVFTSDRGLMLLRGSDVVNISPFMHGKHFVLKGTPKEMIEKTDFKFAIDAMQDKDAFLTFIKDASIAYDYAGQRLILLSKSNTHFQYVYQIDTQTWHKQSGPNTPLKQVINSYPECYVLGEPFENRYLGLLDRDAEEEDGFVSFVHKKVPQLSETAIRNLFRYGEGIDVTHLDANLIDDLCIDVEVGFITRITQYRRKLTRIWDFTTSFDSGRISLKGVITTRPFDLDHPDVKKSIKDIRVRGQFPKGTVKFILEGSDDGENFYVLSSLRGKSWKLFRLTLLCDLGPDDRISWVDVEYETRFENRLR